MGLDMMLYKLPKTTILNKKDWDRAFSEGIEVGYWRKANHIHKWFVDNVQERSR